MIVSRFAAVAVVAGIVLAPAASASAANDEQRLQELAAEAVVTLSQEWQLLEQIRNQSNEQTTANGDGMRLGEVDERGNEIMVELILLGADLTGAARAALEHLPPPAPGRGRAVPPPGAVYEAAIADMQRIVDTPGAVAPDDPSSGRSLGLLAVAAAALLALGLAALSNALRRKGDALELALTDGLTGVNNRRRLDHDLEHHQHLPHSTTAVLMVDIDHFKLINDTFGHNVGDDVLKQFGTLLSEAVREDDVVYRYGGEEFCVLLPGATREEAATVAERVVEAARSITLPDSRYVTASVGVADGAPSDIAETLESADRAMYAAKAGGRDMVQVDASDLVTH